MLIFEEILGLTFIRIVSHTTDATKSLIFGVKNLHLILVTLVPEVFLDFSWRKRSRASREAATRSCESDEEREKNLWLPWPRILLSVQ